MLKGYSSKHRKPTREVHFSNGSKDFKTFHVHNLFYEAWSGIPKPSSKHCLCAKDENYLNFNLDNFEWRIRTNPKNRKFTMEFANKIREDYSKGRISAAQLSKRYKISKTTAEGIISNKIYVDPNYTPIKSDYNAKRKLTNQEVEEIRDLYANTSLTQLEIAKQYNTTQSWISEIVTKKRRNKKD